MQRTPVRKGNTELSKITTVFIDHRDTTCDLVQQGDKEGRENSLAEENAVFQKMSRITCLETIQFQELSKLRKEGVHTDRLPVYPSVRPSILAEYVIFVFALLN
jgi:hypothetical protein